MNKPGRSEGEHSKGLCYPSFQDIFPKARAASSIRFRDAAHRGLSGRLPAQGRTHLRFVEHLVQRVLHANEQFLAFAFA